MAANMIVMCVVVVAAAGHNNFMRPHDAGASMQTPHTQTEVQRTQEEDS